MERAGIPAILVYEDLEIQTPHMHTDRDVVGTSLNSDELFRWNVQTAAATLFHLARPIDPGPVHLTVRRDPGDPETTVRLDWTGGFPPWDVHRGDRGIVEAGVLRDPGNILQGVMTATSLVDRAATGNLLFYTVEIYP